MRKGLALSVAMGGIQRHYDEMLLVSVFGRRQAPVAANGDHKPKKRRRYRHPNTQFIIPAERPRLREAAATVSVTSLDLTRQPAPKLLQPLDVLLATAQVGQERNRRSVPLVES